MTAVPSVTARTVVAPCADCGTRRRARSACPHCGKVFCQRCAEKPYAFCCDPDGGESAAYDAAKRLGIVSDSLLDGGDIPSFEDAFGYTPGDQ